MEGKTLEMKLCSALVFMVSAFLLSAGEFRIDLVSRKSDIDLEIQKTSGNFKVINSPWLKDKRNQSIEIRGETIDEWKLFSFTFLPSKSGNVIFRIRGPYVKQGMYPKVCAYDHFKAKGTKIKNGSFEEDVPSHGWVPGWNTRNSLMTGDAADGSCYMLACYSKGCMQNLAVKAGVPVTISFMAKNAIW